jgi:transcriptional regulator with XRE-family HTH domain
MGIITSIMARRTTPPLPRVERVLAQLGQNIRLARVRRKLRAELVAERAGMSRPTLRSIERGDAGVTLGAVANVLNALGLVDDLVQVGRADELGRELEDAKLLDARVRSRKSRS